jgi:glucose-1-phosphate thymidylyltransferase
VEDIAKVCGQKIDEVAFIIGDFGKEVEQKLLDVAKSIGAKGSIYYQDKPLGTAHAILCAKKSLEGPVIVAFADTLFKADFKLEAEKDGIIWVHKVDDPKPFGVVQLAADGSINNFVEKPETFVSDLAIIGIYYFKDGKYLRSELQYLLDNDIKDKGEYQITNALDNMKNKGSKFYPGAVIEWLDCGNKNSTVFTNQRYLEFIKDEKLVSPKAKITNSVIIEPVFISDNVEITDSVVGPHVSVGVGTKITHSIVKNSIIQENTHIKDALISDSILGSHASFKGKFADLSVGDYNQIVQ